MLVMCEETLTLPSMCAHSVKEPDQMSELDNSRIDEPESKTVQVTIYRCRKCRRMVASDDLVVPHERGGGQSCFKWKKRNNDKNNQSETNGESFECSSLFVEPMKWMEAVEDGCVEDRLQCIGCKSKLGSFNWAGMQCNCGAWVTPAFQIHKNRVDISHV